MQTPGLGMDVTIVNRDFGAHVGQALQVQVDGS